VGDWRKVVFTDECSISAGGSHGNVWVTRKPGEEFLENCIAPKFSDYTAVMIWGAIRGGKKSEVVVWDKKCWASVGAKTYCDSILYPTLFPFWLEQSHQVGGYGGRGTRTPSYLHYTAARQPPPHPTQNSVAGLFS